MSLPSILRLRQLGPDELRQRRQHVDRHGRSRGRPPRPGSSPASGPRTARGRRPRRLVPLPSRSGPASRRGRRSSATGRCRCVKITSVLFVQPVLLQRLPGSAPTDQSISSITSPYSPCLRLALELVADVQRHVRHGVRHVEEERLVLVLVDELHRPLGVPASSASSGRGFVCDRPSRSSISGSGGYVLRRSGCFGHMSFEYGRPKYSSKPCRVGRNCGVVAEVPLAEDRRGVALRLEHCAS